MKWTRLFVIAAVAAGSMAVAPVASAEESCVGEEGTFVLCVEPTGGEITSVCIYAGGTTCETVTVPGPEVTRCDHYDGPGRPSVIEVVTAAVCNALT